MHNIRTYKKNYQRIHEPFWVLYLQFTLTVETFGFASNFYFKLEFLHQFVVYHILKGSGSRIICGYTFLVNTNKYRKKYAQYFKFVKKIPHIYFYK